jgi:pantoate--beta-alanine ligase
MLSFDRIADLRTQVRAWRQAGQRIALVPTLGNLHGGHQSLMQQAAENADRVVVSIFVNPTQFGLGEDYENYPRTLDSDRALLDESGVDVLFAPIVRDVYPNGHQASTHVEVPGISDILCGAFRPGHFRGVATVVCKLLNMVQPDLGVFGEKDWQQLMVIRHMVEDLTLPVEIQGAPTVREDDGLAMSSRNAYLSDGERCIAPGLYRVMQQAAGRVRDGERDLPAVEQSSSALLEGQGFTPQYFVIRRGEDLMPPSSDDGSDGFRILAAAWLGSARLIDNIPVRAG